MKLIDELEKVRKIDAYAVNWLLDTGIGFKGVCDRQQSQGHLFERTVGGAFRAPVEIDSLSDDYVKRISKALS